MNRTYLTALLMSAAAAEATVLTMDEFNSQPVNGLTVLWCDFQLLKEWLSGPFPHLTFSSTSVPEPTTLALLEFGLARPGFLDASRKGLLIA